MSGYVSKYLRYYQVQQFVCLSCCLVHLVKRSVQTLEALSESRHWKFVYRLDVLLPFLCRWFHCF